MCHTQTHTAEKDGKKSKVYLHIVRLMILSPDSDTMYISTSCHWGVNKYSYVLCLLACEHLCVPVYVSGRAQPWRCTNKNQAAMHPHTFLIPPAGSHPLPWWPDKTHTVLSSNWRRRWILTKWHVHTPRWSSSIRIRQESILFQFSNWQANKC